MKKIIIDTDPGIDDSIAIAEACYSNLSILGITTVFGNSTVKNSTINALTILQLLKKNIPVYAGSDKPLFGRTTKAESQGDNGLGGFRLNNLKYQKQKIEASKFIINQLEINKNKSVDIIAIGPLTNLAIVNKKKPDLLCRVNRLIILAGVFFEEGNISRYAEFNAYNDPFALNEILNINCEKILIPINICRKVIIKLEDFQKIQNKKIKDSFTKISRLYIKYYKDNKEYGGFKGGVMYDLLAISFLIRPNLFKLRMANIEVMTNKKKYGQTVIKNRKKNCLLVTDVNARGVLSLFFRLINSKKLQSF